MGQPPAHALLLPDLPPLLPRPDRDAKDPAMVEVTPYIGWVHALLWYETGGPIRRPNFGGLPFMRLQWAVGSRPAWEHMRPAERSKFPSAEDIACETVGGRLGRSVGEIWLTGVGKGCYEGA